MKKYCLSCNHEVEYLQEQCFTVVQVKDTEVHATLSVLTCKECGHEIYDRANEVKNDITVYDEYKKQHKLLTSQEIIQLRKKYDISQETLAKLLGFGLKTITRYENGSIQDEAHDIALRLVSWEENMMKLLQDKSHLLSAKEIDHLIHFLEPKATIEYSYSATSDSPYTTKYSLGGSPNATSC